MPDAKPESSPNLVPLQLDASAAQTPHQAMPVAPVLADLLALNAPVNIRSVSLAVIALFAGVYVLYWAKAVFIAFMVGLVLSYALSPLVNWLEARRIPRALGAGVLLLSLFGVVGTTAYALSDETAKLIESLPAAAVFSASSTRSNSRLLLSWI